MLVIARHDSASGLFRVKGRLRADPTEPVEDPQCDEIELTAVVDTGAEAAVIVCEDALTQLGLHCKSAIAPIITASGDEKRSCSFLARLELATEGDTQVVSHLRVRSLEGLMRDDQQCNALIGLDLLRGAEITWGANSTTMELEFHEHPTL